MTTPTTVITVSDYFRKPEHLARFEALRLPEGADRYIQSALIAISASPDLMACTAQSLYRATLRSASLGLSLDPALKQAWLVPYNRKVKATKDTPEHWVKDAQFQPHYKGLYTLAVRTGKYRIINVGPIYEGQQVLENVMTGLHVVVEDNGLAHEPEIANPAYAIRGDYSEFRNVTKRRDQGKKTIGWMAYFETTRGTKKSVYMSLEEIDEYAKAHVKDYDRNPNWNDAAKRPTMEMKTVFRQLMGWADLSGTENLKLAEALKADSTDPDVIDAGPEWVDGLTNDEPEATPAPVASPENINQETGTVSAPREIADTLGDWAVTEAAKFWNCSKPDAAKELGKAKLGRMEKGEFLDWLKSAQQSAA